MCRPTQSTCGGGASAQPTDTLGNTVLSDPGRAGKVRLFMMVNTTCVGATATVIMRLITATDAALTAGIVIHRITDTIPVASLVAGYYFRIGPDIPFGIPSTGRYLGFQWTIGTAALSAGAFTGGIAVDQQTNPFVG